MTAGAAIPAGDSAAGRPVLVLCRTVFARLFGTSGRLVACALATNKR